MGHLISAMLKTMPRLLQYLGPQHIADSQELGEMVGNETEQG